MFPKLITFCCYCDDEGGVMMTIIEKNNKYLCDKPAGVTVGRGGGVNDMFMSSIKSWVVVNILIPDGLGNCH